MEIFEAHLTDGKPRCDSSVADIYTLYEQELPAKIRMALAEDFQCGLDITTLSTIAADTIITADFVARSAGVICGIDAITGTFQLIDEFFAQAFSLTEYAHHIDQINTVSVISHVQDGDMIAAGQRLVTLTGSAQKILMGERTALNFLCHLSGISTRTRTWVEAVAGTNTHIRDTRKTIPGMRILEKYAVHCGGGVNHRLGLGDAILIKDNHIAAAGSIVQAFEIVKKYQGTLPCEVEVDTLEQLDLMLDAGAELLLLDNFPLWQTAIAVTHRNAIYAQTRYRTQLESSGGLTLEDALDYAKTGVDYLAVGALTHTIIPLDIGLDFREE